MSPLRRAILYMKRHKITVTIIAVIYFFITVLLFLGRSIESSVNTAEENVRASLFPVVLIETKSDKYLYQNQLDIILGLDCVSTLKATISNTCFSSMECVSLNNDVDNQNQPEFTLASNADNDMIEFHNGQMSIVEGRFFTDMDDCKNVVVISKEVADINQINLGAKIDFSIDNQSYELFEVIGIYKTCENNDTTNTDYLSQYNYSNGYNRIYVPQTTLVDFIKKYNDEKFDYHFTKIYVLLNDSLRLNEFESELAKCDWNNILSIVSEDNSFSELFQPLATIRYFASLINGVIIVNGVIVLSMIILISHCFRNKEIGLYLAYGITKNSIMKQLFIEMFLICVLGIVPGVLIGSVFSEQVSKYVLEKQITKETKNFMDNVSEDSIYFTVIKKEDFIENYKANDFTVFCSLLENVFLITFISSGVSVLGIMSKKPKEIMSR